MSLAVPKAAKEMGMARFHVPGMHCGGWPRAVTGALQSVDAYAEMHADFERREVTVKGMANTAMLAAALREARFEGQRLLA